MNKDQTEINLLVRDFEDCYNHVQDIEFYKLFAEEKIHHCKQVIGAGNYIIKHEPVFANYSPEVLRLARQAYIFHDIGRFKEIKALYDHEKSSGERSGWKPIMDHGQFGCEILRSIPEYSDIRIWLPVRHHGHMIEALYEDPDYISLKDATFRRQIRDIIALARDADKIANLYLLMTAGERYNGLFYDAPSEEYAKGPLNEHTLECFIRHNVFSHAWVNSLADRIANILSWVFDINYRSSYEFLRKTKSLDFMWKKLSELNSDTQLQKRLAQIVNQYINYRYEQFKEN